LVSEPYLFKSLTTSHTYSSNYLSNQILSSASMDRKDRPSTPGLQEHC
jgi:hypothetical protein